MLTKANQNKNKKSSYSEAQLGMTYSRQLNLVSIVVPCFNEGSIIKASALTIQKCVSETPYKYEIVFIDDGSTDDTLSKLEELSREDDCFKYISFSRNFGKESAMMAGLEYCRGDCAIIMDADLQHPPELIVQMLQKYEEGFDQVVAQRNRTGDSSLATFFAKNYYKLVNSLVDVEMVDGAGDFRLLSRCVIDALISLEENNRFSKGLYSWVGFERTYIKYENRQRVGGNTKWSFKQLLTYGIDGILSFNNRPLRLCVYLGAALVALSFVYLLYLLIQIAIQGITVPGYFTTIFLVTCLGGAQLLGIGVIGEYIGRIYYEVKKRPNYIVRDTNIPQN